jgi:predicted nucleotidyltransferase
MATKHDLKAANQIRDTIIEAVGDAVLRIVFYGSRATGRARPSSDFDILVVLRDPVPNWLTSSMRLANLFDTFEHTVDVQVFGETEYEESRPVAGTVAYPADRQGIVLYANAGRSSSSAG